jgi:radical SAM superfamily enzyme YgiQ (UPF0313 family)
MVIDQVNGIDQANGSRKKILLVNPACLDERISSEDAGIVPIGLYYIGALLLENKIETHILNLASINDNPTEKFIQIIQDLRPDIIGFSVTNPNRWNAIECAIEAKKIAPNIIIVFGGPAPTFLYDHLFNVCTALDFIVVSEGEYTFLELVNSLKTGMGTTDDFDEIKGLVYQKDNTLVKTATRQPISNLDNLSHPSKYFVYPHLSMSRGCPGKCTFCGSPKFWRNQQVRFHSAHWFVNEIEALTKKGVTHFYISDDTFTMDKERVLELCHLICKKNLKISWNAISRVDYIDDDILLAMRKAGCIQISFGVESGSEKIRKVLGKPTPKEKIKKAFSRTISFGILPRAYFIYGSPGETSKTVKESIELIHDIKPLSAIFYMLVIFPGTHLYQNALNRNLVSNDFWRNKIEDLPWFEIDDKLDFKIVKTFGEQLRSEFYSHLDSFASSIELIDSKELYPFHADFLSRLALTFSHGEYANDNRIKNQKTTARHLFEKALTYAPDARAFLGIAMSLQKEKQFKKTISTLEKGLHQFPDDKDLNTCMGISLMNTRNFGPALEFFKKFSEIPEIKHYIKICNNHIQE